MSLIEILNQSWFFFRKNYKSLAPYIVCLVVLRWLLMPQWMRQSVEVTGLEDMTKIFAESSGVLFFVFLFLSEFIGQLLLFCVFRQIIESPKLHFLESVSSNLSRLCISGLKLILIILVLSIPLIVVSVLIQFVAVAVVGVAGVSVLNLVVTGLFMYILLRLLFIPQIVVHKPSITFLGPIRESFILTQGKVLQIVACIALAIISSLLVATVFAYISSPGQVEKNGSEALFFFEDTVQVHVQVFFLLVLYRLYLATVTDFPEEQGKSEKTMD